MPLPSVVISMGNDGTDGNREMVADNSTSGSGTPPPNLWLTCDDRVCVPHLESEEEDINVRPRIKPPDWFNQVDCHPVLNVLAPSAVSAPSSKDIGKDRSYRTTGGGASQNTL